MRLLSIGAGDVGLIVRRNDELSRNAWPRREMRQILADDLFRFTRAIGCGSVDPIDTGGDDALQRGVPRRLIGEN